MAYDPTAGFSRRLATTVRCVLWDVGTRRALGEPLRGHSRSRSVGRRYELVIQSGWKMLASGAADAHASSFGTSKRAYRSSPCAVIVAEVLAVAFSPDGRTLVSGDKHGDMFFWDVDPKSWRRTLCAKLTRNLSQSEWDTYVGKNVPYSGTVRPGLPRSST